jgi:ABC-type lipoprotein export system ATPase subunit
MLLVDNVTKSYVQRGTVLDELRLEVKKGDSIAIMGPSGTGKTTLLNIIGLLDRPDSGKVVFEGTDIGNFTDDEAALYRNRNIGFIFQDHMLLQHLTILENILLPLLASGYSRKELYSKKEHIIGVMAQTGIEDISAKYPFQISGGEAQRVALVRALANNPGILLADEPTGSLDSNNADNLADLLTAVNRETGVTIILVTHSPSLASKMSRNLRLEAGKLVKS